MRKDLYITTVNALTALEKLGNIYTTNAQQLKAQIIHNQNNNIKARYTRYSVDATTFEIMKAENKILDDEDGILTLDDCLEARKLMDLVTKCVALQEAIDRINERAR